MNVANAERETGAVAVKVETVATVEREIQVISRLDSYGPDGDVISRFPTYVRFTNYRPRDSFIVRARTIAVIVGGIAMLANMAYYYMCGPTGIF